MESPERRIYMESKINEVLANFMFKEIADAEVFREMVITRIKNNKKMYVNYLFICQVLYLWPYEGKDYKYYIWDRADFEHATIRKHIDRKYGVGYCIELPSCRRATNEELIDTLGFPRV